MGLAAFQPLYPVHPVTDQPPGMVFRLSHQIVKSVVAYRSHGTNPILSGFAICPAATRFVRSKVQDTSIFVSTIKYPFSFFTSKTNGIS